LYPKCLACIRTQDPQHDHQCQNGSSTYTGNHRCPANCIVALLRYMTHKMRYIKYPIYYITLHIWHSGRPGCATIMEATTPTFTRYIIEAVTTIGRFDPGSVELCCLPWSWFIGATSLDGSVKLMMRTLKFAPQVLGLHLKCLACTLSIKLASVGFVCSIFKLISTFKIYIYHFSILILQVNVDNSHR